MTYVLIFFAGCMMGGIFGIFTMCMMIQEGQADDREEWFNDQFKKNHR